ncbi:hypothetical protein C8F04DRAFT_1311673 [Mycena alexandri]|uniref:Uncharacterized protein n=1 Tax=Mycena alexandri TaxID=1745969 RepID=A0AAD6S858_9AGAR|nr:hypothetical protein C8F04DRAFT_1311673 [Mycena alexandri]
MVECTAGRSVGFDVNVRPSSDGPDSSIVGVVSCLTCLALRENFIQPTKNATPPTTPPAIALTGGLLRDVEWPTRVYANIMSALPIQPSVKHMSVSSSPLAQQNGLSTNLGQARSPPTQSELPSSNCHRELRLERGIAEHTYRPQNQASVGSEPIPVLRRADHLGGPGAGPWHQNKSHVKPYADLPERCTSEIEHKIPTLALEDDGGTETVPLERRLSRSRGQICSVRGHILGTVRSPKKPSCGPVSSIV